MPIEFACESCTRLLRVPDGSAGLLCECPACRTQLVVPDPRAVGIVESAAGSRASASQIHVHCPKCQHELVCARELMGTKGQCRSCQYIFVISDQRGVPAAAASDWLFNCPKCRQLFEGKPEMRGRKGKCHTCGEVFAIELRKVSANDELSVAPASASGKDRLPKTPLPPKQQVQPQKSPAASAPMRPSSPLSQTPSSQQSIAPKSPASRPIAPKPPTAPLSPIQLVCTNCRGVMEVPGNTAGQKTACPYCQTLLTIPTPGAASTTGLRNETSRQPTAPSPPTDLFASLPGSNASQSSSGGAFDLFAPAANNQASNDLFGASDPFADLGNTGGYASPYSPPTSAPSPNYGRLRSGRSEYVYVIPGVTTIILSLIELLLLSVNMVLQLLTAGDRFAVGGASAQAQGYIVGTLVASITLGILIIVKVIGSVALIRRKGLKSARTAAVISCLPCYCLPIGIPIGIWACVLTFSQAAQKDFRE